MILREYDVGFRIFQLDNYFVQRSTQSTFALCGKGEWMIKKGSFSEMKKVPDNLKKKIIL